MVQAKYVEESTDTKKNNDAKRASSFYGGFSKNRLEIQYNPRFKMWVSTQVPSKFPISSGDRVSNPKFKGGKGTNSPTEKPTCGKCGKKHYGDCLKGTDNCFGCGNSWHKDMDCPNVKSEDKGSGQA